MPALGRSVETAVSVSPHDPYAFASWDSTLPTTTRPPASSAPSAWSPAHSETLYGVDRWGAPYFSLNAAGNISVSPFGDGTLPHQEIDLLKVVKKATGPKSSGGLGLQLPLVVRFPDVLKNRLEALQLAFDHAIESHGYASHYQGVYPVKSNQDKYVVEDVVKFGSAFRFGLESGSKPELLLAMSCLCSGSPEALLVCNGFKDEDYISLALTARKLQLNSVIVLEQEEELDVVIDASRKLGVRPVIGLRAKLRTKHDGHFGSTSGERAKFGLTTAQILRVVKKLEQREMLDCLQLLHFHIGSQIPSTSLLADGVVEAAQIYCELVRHGASMKVIDIGGGLGIDYDGSNSGDSDMSVGYSVEDYASTVVEAVSLVCDHKAVKHPVICSESGRAIVSHHSILVFDVISTSGKDSQQVSPSGLRHMVERLSDEARVVYRNLSAAVMGEENESCVLYAEELKGRCLQQFKEGCLGMEELAAVDGLYDVINNAIAVCDPVITYNVNLSVFTSVPDFWGIGQLFPIMPIHRHHERPGVRGFLSDLTCDSDGKIDKFIGGESSLPLHKLDGKGGCYYLGMFLGGAYEEALGGVHNLFGGPSVVRVVQSDGAHAFAVKSAVRGPACMEVLQAMQYQPEHMFRTLRRRVQRYNDCGAMEIVDRARIFVAFTSMPYLETAAGDGEDAGVVGVEEEEE